MTRASLSEEIGKIKRSCGIEVYDPSQESRVLEYVRSINEGPLADSGPAWNLQGDFLRIEGDAGADDGRVPRAGGVVFPYGRAKSIRRRRETLTRRRPLPGYSMPLSAAGPRSALSPLRTRSKVP